MSPEMNLLSEETTYYRERREDLERQHPNRFVLIHGDRIHGAYDTKEMAIDAGYMLFGEDPYLVRKVGEDMPVISNPALSLGVPLARVQ